MKARLEGNMGKNDEMAGFADADEEFGAGDPPINWARLDELAEVFANNTPLEALKAIYGEKLDVPS
jgi:hypothetical protein